MNKNNYGEVINGQDTYDDIALCISGGKNCLIGWTDEQMSHFDILFHYKWIWVEGSQIQGGIRPKSDLFVSIMRMGFFAFEIDHLDTDSGYYAEKLNMSTGITGEKLAELINGVKKAILNI